MNSDDIAQLTNARTVQEQVQTAGDPMTFVTLHLHCLHRKQEQALQPVTMDPHQARQLAQLLLAAADQAQAAAPTTGRH